MQVSFENEVKDTKFFWKYKKIKLFSKSSKRYKFLLKIEENIKFSFEKIVKNTIFFWKLSKTFNWKMDKKYSFFENYEKIQISFKNWEKYTIFF